MKILYLEDNPRDADLAQSVILEVWADGEFEVVADRNAYLRALQAGGCDLILSDFNLPNFTGIEALRHAREVQPDVPFIFLSGSIGEETAIQALQAGASDYVLKDRPKRLVPAIRRALNDAKLERERRVAAEQLLRVQRLENIGMLAAGIVHDFNNVLSPVIMGMPLLRMRYREERDQKLLNSIENSAQRGVGLVKQILGFVHGVTGARQILQPRHLIRDLIGVVQQTFPKNIRIEDRIEGALWPLKANPTQVHQVLLNLCVNARDAMPEGGTLTLRAENRRLDDVAAAAVPGARAGNFLYLEIADTGTGIPPDIIEKIWEPFFTTKGAGQGTGLGLATVRGIVNDHDGVITLRSQVGQGTSFEILLPADPGDESVLHEAAAAAVPRGQGELILVVDDDTAVREVTCATLVAHGYRVLAAGDGTEALALFAPRSLEIRLVISDLDMPNLDGGALAKVVSALNPAIRLLLVSGSTNESDPRRQPAATGRFLPKPYSAEAMLSAVTELLRGAVPPGPG
ncbi:MAG: response regulator [Opitutaceae bacterium]|nr:response regulator [Opitutaceae bacterium]